MSYDILVSFPVYTWNNGKSGPKLYFTSSTTRRLQISVIGRSVAVPHSYWSTTCRNYLLIVKAWKQRTKIRMGRLPFSHVRMNYFWWAKTERIVVYSAVNLLFRNNKIQLSKCHYITIFMNCKISLTYISETHWKQSIKFQIESMFHFPFS